MPLSRITSPFMSATANVYSPSANTVAIRTSSTDRITVTSAGKVGFGNTSPAEAVTIKSSGASGLLLEVDGADNDSSTRLFARNSANTGGIFFYKYGASSGWALTLGSTAGSATGNPGLTVSAYGLGLGGYNFAQDGVGIKFPASQSASSDANTLDDYEEGTWTPAIAPSSGGSITLKNISARYTKVGRMINVWFTAQVNTISSPTGRLGLTGLPFATSQTPIGGVCLINGFNSFAGHTGTLIESSTTANMDRYTAGGISSDLASYAAVNGYIFFNVTYDIV